MTRAEEAQTTNDLEKFLKRYYKDDILKLAEQYPQEQTSLWIDYTDIYQYDVDIADDVITRPDELRDQFEEALTYVDLPIDIDLSGATVRFHNLDTHAKKVDELRDGDVGELRSVSGQISKASAIRPVVKEAVWECQRCGTFTPRPVENELREPHECQGCERSGPFLLDYDNSEVKNHQLIRIKQPPEEATNSTQIGNEIDAHIEGDLVGYADAGERADVPGVLRVDYEEGDPTLDFYLDAWGVDKVEDDYRGLDKDDYREEINQLISEENPFIELAESIAPGITGGRDVEIETPWGEQYDKYWWVRLGAGIANLFGGWRRSNGDGTFQRGSSHTLLIGDPSTGKSTIMGAIETISPRSASESGKNASGPGLTAAAVKDDFGDSQWSLEAGALVKAHNGVACIDEIDKMQKDGLSRLHSALEKQRLEINKAGIDATLKCETSLLAAGNPEDSRFNRYDTDHSQIDIVGSLLDRFDLVYTFKDKPDREKDTDIARSVIQERAESGLVAENKLNQDERETANPRVDMEKLRAWVAIGRQECNPVIKSESVKKRVREFYVDIRQENAESSGDDDEPVPATVRTLDGLLRLSEACARMRLSEEVEMIDVEVAIALVKISLEDIGYDPDTGKMDADYAAGRTSWSQTDRREKVKGIVENLATVETGADIDNVIETAVGAGMSKEKAEHSIDALKQKGELYEPSTDHLRST